MSFLPIGLQLSSHSKYTGFFVGSAKTIAVPLSSANGCICLKSFVSNSYSTALIVFLTLCVSWYLNIVPVALIPALSVASSFLSPVNVSNGIQTSSEVVPSPFITFPYSASEAGIIKLTLGIARRTDKSLQPIGTPNVSLDKNPPITGMSCKPHATFCCTVKGNADK